MTKVVTRKSHKFKFGKYKGWTVKEVLEEDSGYILWCDQNSVVSFSEKILDEAEEIYYQEEYGTLP